MVKRDSMYYVRLAKKKHGKHKGKKSKAKKGKGKKVIFFTVRNGKKVKVSFTARR